MNPFRWLRRRPAEVEPEPDMTPWTPSREFLDGLAKTVVTRSRDDAGVAATSIVRPSDLDDPDYPRARGILER